MKYCLGCKAALTKKHQLRFCSNQCQNDVRYKDYISKWKRGLLDGNRGIKTRNISGHLKRYLLIKFGNKCANCRWDKKHPVTNASPLEIDHIDGNAENNSESNLRILCPNCHSLTINFKNLNRGKGRNWRKEKYTKNSFIPQY